MYNLACAPDPARTALAGGRAPRPHPLRRTVPRLLAAGIAVAAAACQFDPAGQPGGGTPPDARDAMFIQNDADPDQPDANCDVWPFPPAHFDPCGPGKPVPGQSPLIFDLTGTYTYDTDSGELRYPDGAVVTNPPPSTEERGVRTLWADGVDIKRDAILRVEGTKPLMIVSTKDILVAGTIDVSSSWNPDTKDFDTGAGSGPTDCSSTIAQAGGDCREGGGGGGGGGFSGAGGTGGTGASGRMCDGQTGSPGGTGGRRVTALQPKIRGGCAGARGGNGDLDGLYGVGGAGGGAVHLVSLTRIAIEGAIHAGGAAGAGAEEHRSGGGGGGSGGFIGLEAPVIEIDRAAILAANGGGGGGGTNGTQQPSGQDGQLSAEPATGGTGHNGGDGGEGSAGTSLDGATGGTGDRGGGGGGGGAGYIVIYQSDPAVAGGATLSPPHTRQ